MRSDNMKNILRPGFARTYSLLMDLASDFFGRIYILHIFLRAKNDFNSSGSACELRAWELVPKYI